MENTQRVWIVHTVVLALKFLAVERPWITEIARLNEPIYFKIILISKFKFNDMSLWERGYTFFFTRNEKIWIHFR